jgi:outer membrane protein assembly factor BamB
MAGRIIHAVGGRAAVVATLLLSGCWLQVGADAGHTRFNPIESGLNRANVETLGVAWTAALPGDSVSEAIVADGRVFVTYEDQSGEVGVRAVDVATGATLWNQVLFSAPPTGTVVNVDGAPVAFVGDELWTGHRVEISMPDGSTECVPRSDVLDPATGARIGGSAGFPSAAVSSGTIVARAVNRRSGAGCGVYTGQVLEVSRHEPDGSTTSWHSAKEVGVFGNAMPTLAGDQVLVWGSGTTVDSYPVDGCGAPTCMPTWTATLDGLAGFLSVPMAGATGPAFVLTGSNLVALDRETGAELWRAPLGGPGVGMALAEGTLYVTAQPGGGEGGLLAFDTAGCGAGAVTCEPLWTGSGEGTPAVGGGVVYATYSGYVRAFDAAGCGAPTCSPLTSVWALSPQASSLAQGRLFVSVGGSHAAGGVLAAFAPATG